MAHLYEVTALIAKPSCRGIKNRYLTKIRIQLFVVSHPLNLIHRICIFGIACPAIFFAQIKRVEIVLVVCHNQESAQSGICTNWISSLQMKNDRNAINYFDFMDSYPQRLDQSQLPKMNARSVPLNI